MTSVTDLREMVEVVIGVDTHVEFHVAAAVDVATGAMLDTITVPAEPGGYASLVSFADKHSPARFWAIEGTCVHGAGLTRHLIDGDLAEIVVEIDRPARTPRRNGAKTDVLDAQRTAREALSRPRLGAPRCGARRDSLAALLAVRRSAVDGAADGARQLFGLAISAPEVLRERLQVESNTSRILFRAKALRINKGWDEHTVITARALRNLAVRVLALRAEAAGLEKQIKAIVSSWRPELLHVHGVGPIVAAIVLCAWSHPGRIDSREAFAMLAGAAPIPANSGKTTTRYRLNRSGDRRLNSALHTIALSRMRYDERTRAYVTHRQSHDGGNKSLPDIRRCLKTYIARELYQLLEAPTRNPKNNRSSHMTAAFDKP